ncbi:MAG: glycogen debranching N-terminal domain-containing protein [Methylocella sp.]|nr:MAG: hypothetical protein DLM68_13730 [Hyphomicrobiales bacterium]
MADRPLSVDIKHPLLLKNGDLFLVTEQNGSVPQGPPGFGLFYRDCCYLSQYELSLNGTRPLLLMSAWDEGFAARDKTSYRSLGIPKPRLDSIISRCRLTAVCRSSSPGPNGKRVFLPPTVRAPTR